MTIRKNDILPPSCSARLLAWYDENRRVLPWREDPTPYHVWVSEIMLQQTRVEAVKGYYARFLDRFPDIPSLASAEESEVLKLWEGLGYYSRGRNLHKAAQILVENYGGKMPPSRDEIRRLPGIGDYTASAIASIAFGEKTPAVDGNLLRIFSRMTCCRDEIGKIGTKKRAEAYYSGLMPDNRPGDFNQALMDLGSGICAAHGTPACPSCPWREFCRAFAEGNPQDFPVKAAKKERRKEKRTVLILRSAGRIFLDKRPEKGLLAGLYEFPNPEGDLTPDEIRAYCRNLGLTAEQIMPLGEAKHVFSHLEWHMKGYEVVVGTNSRENVENVSAGAINGVWATPEEIRERYSLPSAFDAFRARVVQTEFLAPENDRRNI